MLETLTAVFAVLTSGAGGGLLGGVFAIFKQREERKERVEMEKINLQRDQIEYQNAEAEREHSLIMLKEGGRLEVEKIQTESEAEIEVAHQSALSSAQEVFAKLKTSTGMDDYRSSVRPTLAYWAAALFTAMLIWAFFEFHKTIDEETGKQILIGMFGTLTFIVTSVISFYYISRRNSAPKG